MNCCCSSLMTQHVTRLHSKPIRIRGMRCHSAIGTSRCYGWILGCRLRLSWKQYKDFRNGASEEHYGGGMLAAQNFAWKNSGVDSPFIRAIPVAGGPAPMRLAVSFQEDYRIVKEPLKPAVLVQRGRYSSQDLGERDNVPICPLILQISIGVVMPAAR